MAADPAGRWPDAAAMRQAVGVMPAATGGVLGRRDIRR
jgi:hypothetical protein